MKNKPRREGKRGFIHAIIIIVGALVALKYFFDFDIVDLLAEGNYRAVWEWIVENVWQKFIVETIWTRISSWLPKK